MPSGSNVGLHFRLVLIQIGVLRISHFIEAGQDTNPRSP